MLAFDVSDVLDPVSLFLYVYLYVFYMYFICVYTNKHVSIFYIMVLGWVEWISGYVEIKKSVSNITHTHTHTLTLLIYLPC
jgi:hypothetical protein